MLDFNDPQIWVAIAFALFFILFGKFLWKKLSTFLNQNIEKVRSEITEANNIYNDTKTLLASETKKFQDLENQIKIIIEKSKMESQLLFDANKIAIDEEVKRLEKSMLEKISFMENQVINELKNKIASAAIQQAEKFLIKKLNNKSQLESINFSLQEIENSIKNKKNTFI